MKLRKVKIPPQSISENVSNIITELKSNWGEKKITIGTMHILLKECMELADKLDCPGPEKKTHVITIIKAVIIDLVEDPDQERLILELIDKDVLGNTMDLIVLAAHGQLNLKNKKTQKQILSCCKTSIPLLINAITQIVKAANKKPKSTVTSTATATPEENEVV